MKSKYHESYFKRKRQDPKWCESRRKYVNNHFKMLHQMAISVYGGACQCCGEHRVEFLTIDHIQGDGGRHRRHRGRMLYKDVVDNVDHSKYRVLCMNCNWARRFGKTCPHEVERANLAVGNSISQTVN